MFRRLAATVAAAALVAVGLAAPAVAAGSGDLLPTAATCAAGGGCRPAIEWRTGYYGPTMATGIPRRTLFSVYAVAGEQILLGSSSLPAAGAGSSDIVVWNPGVVTDRNAATLPAAQFSCVAQRATSGNGTRGFIANRAEELAGAESVDGSANPAGYRPCTYTAPSTGLYNVAFYGTDGGSSDLETSTDGVIAPAGAFALYRTSVAAWDVTVRPASVASTADEAGRLFTYVFAGFTGDNPRPVDMAVYLTTLDGFRYRVDTNGFDPNGFVFYGNQVGFLDADGAPLNHDIVPVPGTANQQVMRSLAGGVQIAPAQYPVSLEPLAAVTLNALGIPTTPTNPTVTAASYTGRITSTGSYRGQGGDFTFTTGTGGTYEIVVSRDGVNYDPGLAVNRSLRGVVGAAGTYTVPWDGLDNADTPFPVGDNFTFTVTLRSGEYHAPMIDVESSVKGGPAITLENPPNGTCPFTGVASNGSNCTRAFYDDRAYLSANGTQVGDPVSGQLCSTLVRASGMPLTTFANYQSGYDSAGTARAFGTSVKTNVNKACDATTPSTLGDARGLDLWTYFPSALLTRTLDVLPVPAAPVADDDAYTTPANTTLTVPAASGVLTGDTGTALTVTASTTPAQGTVTVGADGALQYVPATGFSGSVTFDYTVTDDAGQSDTGTVTITVTPTGVADSGAVATGGVLTVAAAAGLLSNDVGTSLTVTASTQPGHGTVGVGADGGYTYTPTVGYSGADTFTYTARDAAGQTYTRTVALTVTPTAADDAATTPANTAVTPAGGLLGNDHGSLTILAHTAPAHGTVTVDAATGAYTYTPADDWSGVDPFSYTVTDGVSAPLTRAVTLTVTPVGADDADSTAVDDPLTAAETTSVLADDLGALTVTSSTAASHGTATVAADGSWTYTPTGGWSGTDTFTYTAQDGAGQTVTQTVTVVVVPTAADDSGSTSVGTPLVVPASSGVLANDRGALTVTGNTQPGHGTAAVGPDGAFTYTPTPGWSGVDTFTYTVSDGANPALTRSVTVTVAPPLVAPAASDDETTTRPAVPVVLHPLVNDPAGDHRTWAPGTLVLVDPATGAASRDVVVPGVGRWVVLADGGVQFTSEAGFLGTGTLVYRVQNDAGQQVEARLVVHTVVLATTGTEVAAALAAALALVALGVGFLALRRRREDGLA